MAFSVIAASDVDSDSPITDTLMNTIRTNFDDHETRLVVIEADPMPHTVGDLLNNSLDTERTTTNTSYVKTKEFTLSRGGTIRIKFDLRNTYVATTGYGRIYRNGVAVGTEQSRYGDYQTFSEDIPGWLPGDTLELWFKVTGGTGVKVKNFRLYTDPPDITQSTYDA